MALQNFVDYQGPVVSAAWLNELDVLKEAMITPTIFTPTIIGATLPGTVTYSTRVGYYMRIGKLIFFSANIVITNLGGATGTVRMTGLPTASKNVTDLNHSVALGIAGNISLPAGYVTVQGRIPPAADYVEFTRAGSSNQNPAFLDMAHLTNASSFNLSASYLID